MKHFAVQASAQSQVVVLSPGRTIGKGWLAMGAVLNFEGTARDLLSDLARAAVRSFFIDSLDFYSDEERRTVIDLIRAAAKVPGCVGSSPRAPEFGVVEDSWLPAAVLDQLGRASRCSLTN